MIPRAAFFAITLPDPVRAALHEATAPIPAFPVTAATLYESHAGRGGSVYEARASIRLDGPGGSASGHAGAL